MLTLHFPECYPEVSGSTVLNTLGSSYHHHHHHQHQHHLDYSNSSSSLAAISPHSATATTPSPLTADNSMDTAAAAAAAAAGVRSSSANSVRNASPQSDGAAGGGGQYYFEYSAGGVGGDFDTTTNTTVTSQGSLLCSPNLGGGDNKAAADEAVLSMLEHSAVIAPGTVQQRVYPIVYSDTSMVDKNAYLTIIEQPTNRIRYRYRSEKGSHGGLNGESSTHPRKTYPTVRLEGYCRAQQQQQIFVRASLATNEPCPRAHVHKLMSKHCSENGDCTLATSESLTCIFPNLGILFTGKKEVPDILLRRKQNELRFRSYEPITAKVEERLRKEAEAEAKDMNLNSVKICFEAFVLHQDALYPVCVPVYSKPIANQKSPDAGELKIVRISRFSGLVTGGTEVYILCEKVNKKDIKVRFYELDSKGNQQWTAFGTFTEADVHHQVAIVFRAPAYRDQHITRPVHVYFQLYRVRDGECSEPRSFIYKPKMDHRSGQTTSSTTSASVGSKSNSSSSSLGGAHHETGEIGGDFDELVAMAKTDNNIQEGVLSQIKRENQPPSYKRRKFAQQMKGQRTNGTPSAASVKIEPEETTSATRRAHHTLGNARSNLNKVAKTSSSSSNNNTSTGLDNTYARRVGTIAHDFGAAPSLQQQQPQPQHPQHQQMSHLLLPPLSSASPSSSPCPPPSLSSPMSVGGGGGGGAHSPMHNVLGGMDTLLMSSHCSGDEQLDQQQQQQQFHPHHHQQSLHHLHHHHQPLHPLQHQQQPQDSFEPLDHFDWTGSSPSFSVGSFFQNFMATSTPIGGVGGGGSLLHGQPQQAVVSSTAGAPSADVGGGGGESTFLVLNANGQNTFISGQPEATTLDVVVGNNPSSNNMMSQHANGAASVGGNIPEPMQLVRPGQCMIYT